jgi:hypothetical protein
LRVLAGDSQGRMVLATRFLPSYGDATAVRSRRNGQDEMGATVHCLFCTKPLKMFSLPRLSYQKP